MSFKYYFLVFITVLCKTFFSKCFELIKLDVFGFQFLHFSKVFQLENSHLKLSSLMFFKKFFFTSFCLL